MRWSIWMPARQNVLLSNFPNWCVMCFMKPATGRFCFHARYSFWTIILPWWNWGIPGESGSNAVCPMRCGGANSSFAFYLFCRECLQTWSKLSGRVVYPGFYVCRGWQTCLSLFEQQPWAICGTTPRHRVGEYPQAAEAAIRTRIILYLSTNVTIVLMFY